jgi:hypothetical protein
MGAHMNVSLATSLHLDHGAMTLDHKPGDPIPLQSFVPVGLLCLKAYADARDVPADIRVTEINGLVNSGRIPNDERFYPHLVDGVVRSDDHLVGLMTDADSLHHTLVLAREIKARVPGVLVCLGGPAASPIGRALLSAFPWIDFVVSGEGEVTFAELLEHLDAGRPPIDILGLSWRDPTGHVIENESRPVIRELDDLPIPSFAAVGSGADSAMYLDVGRGCPFQCHFCATAPFWDRRYRMKSIERILTEMRMQRTIYGRQHVSFSHDIFTCNQRWTKTFCEEVAREDVGVTWSCSTRTDIINSDLLDLMAAAGCVEIYYGIETGSSDMQQRIHKNLDLDNCRRIVAATAAAGIRPVTGFIVGYPTETRETFGTTLDRFFDFLEVGGHRAHLFTLCPFHEAPMYRDGHEIDRPAAYFEPPLVLTELAKGTALRTEYPDIFSSLQRFATPQINEALVDASEEISARLVVLKSVWPQLLRHYSGALDWYERWVEWIRLRNAEKRPATRMPYQGEIEDLLDFLEEEITRLGMTGSGVADLIRYERHKARAARCLPVSSSVAGSRSRTSAYDPTGAVGPDSVVARTGELLVVPFDRDLSTLLRGGDDSRSGRTWVVFVRRNGRDLDALQVGRDHADVLSRVAEPRHVHNVIAGDGDAKSDPAYALRVVRELVDSGLLVEVRD